MHTSHLQLLDLHASELLADLRRRADHTAELSAIDYVLNEGKNPEQATLRSVIFQLQKIFGFDEEKLDHQLRRLRSMCARFIEFYGDGPVAVLRVPARINILGEHIDYVSYLPTASLPFGSREYDMLMLYRRSETDCVRGASALPEYEPFHFTLADGPSADATASTRN